MKLVVGSVKAGLALDLLNQFDSYVLRNEWGAWKNMKMSRALDTLFDRAFEIADAIEEKKKVDIDAELHRLLTVMVVIRIKAAGQGGHK
jgi:hypothetical protein